MTDEDRIWERRDEKRCSMRGAEHLLDLSAHEQLVFCCLLQNLRAHAPTHTRIHQYTHTYT